MNQNSNLKPSEELAGNDGAQRLVEALSVELELARKCLNETLAGRSAEGAPSARVWAREVAILKAAIVEIKHSAETNTSSDEPGA